MMGLYMVVESWLNDQTESQIRGRVFSVYMSMTFIGLGFGQFLLTLGNVNSATLFLVVGIFSVLSLIPVAMARSISPELPATTSMKTGRLFRSAPTGLLGAVATGMIASGFYSLAPVFARSQDLSVNMVAYFMSATILSGFLMLWPVGNLSDRYDRERMLGGLSLLVCITSVMVALAAPVSVWQIFLLTILFGGIAFTL